VIEHRWGPDAVLATHAHAFEVDPLVTQGEMGLACAGRAQHLKPGDRFALQREAPHDDCTLPPVGPAGAGTAGARAKTRRLDRHFCVRRRPQVGARAGR
jgi:hypothetical protein